MSSVRVRMYRQGLGDCFLLTFDVGADTKHVLIDCGVLKGTADPQARMRYVAQSIHDATGGKLDVLVATHEHWDHLSGFLDAKDVFDGFTVGEVWVAWTEDPEDDLAKELRTRKKRAIGIVAAAANRLAAAESRSANAAGRQLEALLDFHGDIGLDGRPTTANALEWVKGLPAEVRCLGPGKVLDELGVRVYVLGPPHDRAQIKRSDPSKRHSEVYELPGDGSADLGFFVAAEALEGGETGPQPFDRRYRLGDHEVGGDELVGPSYRDPAEAWRRIDDDWLAGGAGRLALQLDSDTNNTSLVLAFELGDGGPVLLFPGDAQVGNWLSWDSVEWPTSDGAAVNAADLLARTVLYKVGHHGSHNATMREHGLERMVHPDLVAMIPVDRATAEKKKWKMPFGPLFDRLQEKTKGRVIDAELGVADTRPPGLTADDWEGFLERTEVVDRTDVQAGWIDHTINW